MKTKDYTYNHCGTSFKAVKINVSHVLSIQELAYFFTSATYLYDNTIDQIKTISEKEFMKIIKRELSTNGEEKASYVVGDNNLNGICDEVKNIINERFCK